MKLVHESVEDVLKPKDQGTISSIVNKVIDDFVNNLSYRDFDKSFENVSRGTNNKKFKIGKETQYVSDLTNMRDVVEDLSFTEKFDGPLGIDVQNFQSSYKFPKFNEFLTNLQTNASLTSDYYNSIMDNVVKKLAAKFNVVVEM